MESKITLNVELYSSKNSRQFVKAGNGRSFLIKSKQARQQEDELIYLLLKNKPKWENMRRDKTYPYHIVFEITRKTKRRFDYINIIQNLADMMTKANYIEDDDANHFLPVFKEYNVDKDNPSVTFYFLDNN